MNRNELVNAWISKAESDIKNIENNLSCSLQMTDYASFVIIF